MTAGRHGGRNLILRDSCLLLWKRQNKVPGVCGKLAAIFTSMKNQPFFSQDDILLIWQTMEGPFDLDVGRNGPYFCNKTFGTVLSNFASKITCRRSWSEQLVVEVIRSPELLSWRSYSTGGGYELGWSKIASIVNPKHVRRMLDSYPP
jgi:hypothetical protein